jgi:hypothetical protein
VVLVPVSGKLTRRLDFVRRGSGAVWDLERYMEDKAVTRSRTREVFILPADAAKVHLREVIVVSISLSAGSRDCVEGDPSLAHANLGGKREGIAMLIVE